MTQNIFPLLFKALWLRINCKSIQFSNLKQKENTILMVREIWAQFQVASYERFLKWYLIAPCLTLNNIRYVSRVKWRNPGKGVAPSPTSRCRSYWKGSLLVSFDYGCQLYLLVVTSVPCKTETPCILSKFLSWSLIIFTVFRQLSSLLYSQRFDRYTLQVFLVELGSLYGILILTLNR